MSDTVPRSRGDRGRKRSLYQRTVPEYWFVDPDACLVERWMPGDERPETRRTTLPWRAPGAAAALSIDLERLFAGSLDESP